MRNAFLDTAEDIKWLNETHLKGVILPTKWKEFKFAIIQGNEDSPHAVNLYLAESPNYNDDYYRVIFVNDPPVYCECREMNGKTDTPKHF